jgi:hypothetical protein
MKYTLITLFCIALLLSFSQSCRKPSANNTQPNFDTCRLITISHGLLPDNASNNFEIKYQNGKIISLTSSKYLINYYYTPSQFLKRKEKFLKSTNELVASEEFITNTNGQITEQLDTVFIAEEGYQKSINRCLNTYINNQLVEKRFFDRYNNLAGRNLFRWNNDNLIAISRYDQSHIIDSIEISYDTTKLNKITDASVRFIIQDLSPGSAAQFQFPVDIIQVSSKHLISRMNSVNGLSSYNISYQFNSKNFINQTELNGASYWRFTYDCD